MQLWYNDTDKDNDNDCHEWMERKYLSNSIISTEIPLEEGIPIPAKSTYGDKYNEGV